MYKVKSNPRNHAPSRPKGREPRERQISKDTIKCRYAGKNIYHHSREV